MKNSVIEAKTCLPDEAKFDAFMLQYRQLYLCYQKAVNITALQRQHNSEKR